MTEPDFYPSRKITEEASSDPDLEVRADINHHAPQVSEYYWYAARDNSFTPAGIQLFQVACRYDGHPLEEAKSLIDRDYDAASGGQSNRHGGKFHTAVLAYKEVGWIDTSDGKLRITEAGRQAQALLQLVPEYLRAVPKFLISLLSRYQINNPGYPTSVKNHEIAETRSGSDIFPYWTIWKIMSELDWRITAEELRRFVFRLESSDDIPKTIQKIKQFRIDKASGKAELATLYPEPLEGTKGETKYWMGRAGAHIGHSPALLVKPTSDTWLVSEPYRALVNQVISQENVFSDYIDESTWMQFHGRAVPLGENPESHPRSQFSFDSSQASVSDALSLIESGKRNIAFSGPPGTGKSWLARSVAEGLEQIGSVHCVKVQFHPSFGYEHFIEGYVPAYPKSGPPVFSLKPKILQTLIAEASKYDYIVLIIDEMSRGDVGRIFGESLTYIEEEYRGEPFTLASGNSMSLPPNLVTLATLNPYDRSVVSIDLAILRRFQIMDVYPNVETLSEILRVNNLPEESISHLRTFLQRSVELLPEGGIGHTYFFDAYDGDSLARIWKFQLKTVVSRQLILESSYFDELEEIYQRAIRAASTPAESDSAS